MLPISYTHCWLLRPAPGEVKYLKDFKITLAASSITPNTVYVRHLSDLVMTTQGYYVGGVLRPYVTKDPRTVQSSYWHRARLKALEAGEATTFPTLPYLFTPHGNTIVATDVKGDVVCTLYPNSYRVEGYSLRSYPKLYAFLRIRNGYERLWDYEGGDMTCEGDPTTFIITLYATDLYVTDYGAVYYDETYLGLDEDLLDE